jgi:hypothetical protein
MRHLQVVVAEQVHRHVLLDEVELVQQDHVGTHPLQHLGDIASLEIVQRAQVLDQLAGRGPVEAGVVGRETYHLVPAVPLALGGQRRRGQHPGHGGQHGHEHCCDLQSCAVSSPPPFPASDDRNASSQRPTGVNCR